MGGTLDNGIYLPDQGERNCYNGLKNNWDTLDNLIETVQALSSAGLTREIVNSLPTENIKTNVIYMLRNSQQSGDLYDEYMYINNAWEPIGTSATEMDNYYTKSETNALPAVASGITASKVTGYDSHVANTEVHITAAERSTWNGKQNALDTDQTAAVNSGVNATKVTGYDSHVSDTDIHVTTSDKTAWNAKQDGLSQTQLNAVNSGVTDTKVTGYDTHVADSSAHVSSADRTAWNGKQNALTQTQLDNIAAVPNKANAADLATVATTGDYGDLLNAPTIPTVNNAALTIQKNGTDVATFTANASSNVTANLSIPVNTSDLNNDAGFLTQHNPIDNELSVSSENAVQNKVVTTALNGKAASSHTHAAGDINTGTFNIARIPDLDASKITSGTIDIARLPKGSLERLVKVADQAARFALTTDDVQLGDTVQQLDTGVMYAVTDVTKLDSADGYTEFTAGSATSVPWSGVTGKPSTFTPSSHTHGNISNDGKVGTTANLPLITGTGGVVQAGAFGNQANTICEGNDSRLSDARTPTSHTHGSITNDGKLGTASVALVTDANKNIAVSSVTATELGYLSGVTSAIQTQIAGKAPAVHTHTKSDVTDLLNSNFIPSANNSYDLGSSSYQWNNVYSKGYYYNGVAWGLDKNNKWLTTNLFYGSLPIFLRGSDNDTYNVSPQSLVQSLISFVDKNNTTMSNIVFQHRTEATETHRLCLRQQKVTSDGYYGVNLNNLGDFYPENNNTINLGNANCQWNNVYAKGYYYNGTAWGLDQSNTWSSLNTFQKGIYLAGDRQAYVCPMWSGSSSGLSLLTNSKAVFVGAYTDDASGRKVIDTTKGYIRIHTGANDGNNLAIIEPSNVTNSQLGTSTNKWKTLWANGINSVPTNTVEWHNSHYRGINLISTGHFANMAALLTAIRNQDWSDIYIGDYVKLTFTYEGASRTVTFYVGEIDKFYKVGDTSLETHHLVMVTGNLGKNQAMNDSNTTAGGYVGSKAHTVTLPALYAILNPLFNNAILTHKEHLSNTVISAQSVSLSLNDGNGAVTYSCNNFPVYSSGDPNTPGCVTEGNWYDCNLVLMSEIEMFGSNRFASSGIDDTMCPEGQIAAFKYNRNLQTLNRKIHTWLRNVNSASRFCYCRIDGSSNRRVASDTFIQLRPRFLIG